MGTNGQDWNGFHVGSLEKSRPTFFWLMANPLDKVVFAQNYLVCDVTFILSVKECRIIIVEFKLVIN